MSDALHEAAIEAACDLDREYADRHPNVREYVRPALEHEMCLPGYACTYPVLMRVVFIEPGVRARQPVFEVEP